MKAGFAIKTRDVKNKGEVSIDDCFVSLNTLCNTCMDIGSSDSKVMTCTLLGVCERSLCRRDSRVFGEEKAG